MGSSRITAGVISGTGNIDSWISGMGIAGSSVPGSGRFGNGNPAPGRGNGGSSGALFSFQGTTHRYLLNLVPLELVLEYQPRLHLQFFG